MRVKGPTSEMEECKKIIQEVCETGSMCSVCDLTTSVCVLKEHVCVEWDLSRQRERVFYRR